MHHRRDSEYLVVLNSWLSYISFVPLCFRHRIKVLERGLHAKEIAIQHGDTTKAPHLRVEPFAFLPLFRKTPPSTAGNAGIRSPQILATRKFIPEPDMPETVGVLEVGFEVRLHEPLKPVALVALGEGVFAVVGQEGLEGHWMPEM